MCGVSASGGSLKLELDVDFGMVLAFAFLLETPGLKTGTTYLIP